MFHTLDRVGSRLLGLVQRNPAPASSVGFSLAQLPWPAERAVRLAWIRAYLDALGLTGEVREARWEQAVRAPAHIMIMEVWSAPAATDESEDALVEARRASRVQDPQKLGAGLDVDWRQVTEDALERWWDTSDDARDLLIYAGERISRKALVLLAAACARTALRYVPTGEERPRITIETAEAWARGEATLGPVRAAADTADARTAAPAAARVAVLIATAERGVAAAVGAADAAHFAATAAANVAAPSVASSTPLWKSAFQRALRELADLVRSMQPFPGW